MKDNRFQVIKGGYSPELTPERRVFLSAETVDTRLMGVSALRITWEYYPHKDSAEGMVHFHQFFYYDAEEFGLDSYRSMQGDDPLAFKTMERSMIGGLGGTNIPVTEREARALVQYYVHGSGELGVPLAEPKEEYAFLLREHVLLSDEEKKSLWFKITTKLRSANHLINYFVMRVTGLDRGAVTYLSDSPETAEEALLAMSALSPEPITLHKNEIVPHEGPEGRSYLTEAVLEDREGYLLAVMELTLKEEQDPNLSRVSSFRVNSFFRISPEEAAMQLNRDEYITCFEITEGPEIFDLAFELFSIGFMLTNHDTGRLFMEFNENNDHVNSSRFLLHEDVHGLYYISDFGQFIIAAYTPVNMQELELRIAHSPLREMVGLSGRFRFRETMLYDFIESGAEDFIAYVESMREE